MVSDYVSVVTKYVVSWCGPHSVGVESLHFLIWLAFRWPTWWGVCCCHGAISGNQNVQEGTAKCVIHRDIKMIPTSENTQNDEMTHLGVVVRLLATKFP